MTPEELRKKKQELRTWYRRRSAVIANEQAKLRQRSYAEPRG